MLGGVSLVYTWSVEICRDNAKYNLLTLINQIIILCGVKLVSNGHQVKKGTDSFNRRLGMDNRYFRKRKWFGKWCRNIKKELIDSHNIKKWACSFCPSRNDRHYMNCLECCPVKRACDK